MAATTHIAPDTLKHFANGRLSLAECELILDHLAQCDRCLEKMDVLWSTRPENAAATLPPDVARRLERHHPAAHSEAERKESASMTRLVGQFNHLGKKSIQ